MRDFDSFQQALDDAQDPHGAARRRAADALQAQEVAAAGLAGSGAESRPERESESGAGAGAEAEAGVKGVIAGVEGRAAASKVEVPADDGYILQLTRSMSLVLDEFYQGLRYAGVSALTGQGMNELFEKISEAGQEYYDDYYPEIEATKRRRAEEEARRVQEGVDRLHADAKGGKSTGVGEAAAQTTAASNGLVGAATAATHSAVAAAASGPGAPRSSLGRGVAMGIDSTHGDGGASGGKPAAATAGRVSSASPPPAVTSECRPPVITPADALAAAQSQEQRMQSAPRIGVMANGRRLEPSDHSVPSSKRGESRSESESESMQLAKARAAAVAAKQWMDAEENERVRSKREAVMLSGTADS